MTDDLLGGVVEDDSDLAHLPASERKAMQRLRDWLSCDDRSGKWLAVVNPNGWLPWPEVVCLLSGIDPEASLDADPAGWALLPGVLAFWGLADRPGREELEATVSSHIARVSKMIRVLEQKSGVPADLSPVEAIRAALAARLPVPWLDVALSDPVCRQFLPEELRLAEWRADVPRADPETRAPLPPEALNWYSAAGEAPASILKNPGQSGASPQSKGGKHRPDDEIVAIYVAAVLHENGVKPPRIVERLNEMNLPGKRDAVGRWLKKMGDPKQGPGVDALLSSAGRTREELEGLRAKAVSRTEKLRSSS